MITLEIGSEQRKNGSIKERWIAQQIKKRRKDGQPTCIRLTIDVGDVNVSMSTAACSGGGGGGRTPNRKERKLLDLWVSKGLKKEEINAGMIISFLNQYDKYI